MSKDQKRLIVFGPFEIDREDGLLFCDGGHVPLPPKVFQTLLVLVESRGRLMPKDELMKAIWPDTFVEEHNLTLNIHALRKVLNRGSAPERYIETVPRRGYRFIAPVQDVVRAPVPETPVAAPAQPTRPLVAAAAWIVILLVLGAGAIAAARLHRGRPADADAGPALVRLTNNIADDRQPDVSPDGRTIVFVTNRDGEKDEIYAMDADGGDLRNLTQNPANDRSPAWSPDGKRIAFESDRRGTQEIFVMNADGSLPIPLAPGGRAAWSPDGKRLAFQRSVDHHSEIFAIDAAGGEAKRLTFDQGFDGDPSWSPDGRHLAFSGSDHGQLQVEVMLLDGTERTTLTHHGQNRLPAWSRDGRILFNSDRDGVDALFVMNADGSVQHRLDAPLNQGVEGAWWPGGRAVVFESDRDGNTEIYRMRLTREPDGAVRLTQHVADDDYPTWSPDGKWIAFQSNRDGKANIFAMDAGGGQVHNVSRGAARDIQPAWSPDGSRIAFASDRGGAWAIYAMRGDGGDVRKLTDGRGEAAPQWSPDSGWICFSRDSGIWVAPVAGGAPQRVATGETCSWSADQSRIIFDRDTGNVREVYSVPAHGGGEVSVTRNGRGNGGPAWSRDGSRIALNSNSDGLPFGIFVMNPDGSGLQRITGPITFDEHPAWSPDGRSIAFSSSRDGNQEIYRISVP